MRSAPHGRCPPPWLTERLPRGSRSARTTASSRAPRIAKLADASAQQLSLNRPPSPTKHVSRQAGPRPGDNPGLGGPLFRSLPGNVSLRPWSTGSYFNPSFLFVLSHSLDVIHHFHLKNLIHPLNLTFSIILWMSSVISILRTVPILCILS